MYMVRTVVVISGVWRDELEVREKDVEGYSV